MAADLFHHVLPLLMLSFLLSPAAATTTQHQAPTPEPWPEQFHAVLFMNYSNALSLADLWYDWPGGRNLHIIKDQLGGHRFFDLEWNNGTSFFYYKEEPLSCRSVQLDVGVLRPNWLDGATYLGRAQVDGFLCDAWTKADFIWYYQDVDTKRPVKWVFYTGRTTHVMAYEVGAILEDSAWQTPAYCFQKNNITTVQQLENPEMFSLHIGLSINHNLIREKMMFRRSLGS